MDDFSRTHISVIGAEDNFGANAMDQSKLPREAVVWMGVAHGDRRAIDIWCVLPSLLFVDVFSMIYEYGFGNP